LNVVFDLGGVVVRWDPEAIVASVFPETAIREKAKREVFGHADWLELDRGALAPEQAIARAAQRTGIPARDVRRLLQAVPPSLTPVPETVALLHRLHAAGHALYCLSNMGFAGIEHLEREHGFLALFRGKVVSCRLNVCKPEPQIFEHLLRTYALVPEQTVFIDDVEANIVAAARFGMRVIRFESAAQCERELVALGLAR
jgi:putative hydrolase of the HAD superfamily